MAYITITDDLNDKQLTPSEKMVLALVQGFSQENQGVFYGSLNYISWWLGCTKKTTSETMKRLVGKGFLIKGEIYVDGVRRCTYKTSETYRCKIYTGVESSTDRCKIFHDTGVESTPYNTIDNTIDNTIYPNPISRSRDEVISDLQQSFWKSLQPFVGQYTEQMLQEFCDYWSAPLLNPTSTQVKKGIFLLYQSKETWSLAGRLRTWERKNLEFAAKNATASRHTFRPATNDRGETRMVEAYRKADEAIERAVMTASDERRMYELQERRR